MLGIRQRVVSPTQCTLWNIGPSLQSRRACMDKGGCIGNIDERAQPPARTETHPCHASPTGGSGLFSNEQTRQPGSIKLQTPSLAGCRWALCVSGATHSWSPPDAFRPVLCTLTATCQSHRDGGDDSKPGGSPAHAGGAYGCALWPADNLGDLIAYGRLLLANPVPVARTSEHVQSIPPDRIGAGQWPIAARAVASCG